MGCPGPTLPHPGKVEALAKDLPVISQEQADAAAAFMESEVARLLAQAQ